LNHNRFTSFEADQLLNQTVMPTLIIMDITYNNFQGPMVSCNSAFIQLSFRDGNDFCFESESWWLTCPAANVKGTQYPSMYQLTLCNRRPVECAVLSELYDSTDGPNWVTPLANAYGQYQWQSNYTGMSCCGWPGVTCNDNATVSSLCVKFSFFQIFYIYIFFFFFF